MANAESGAAMPCTSQPATLIPVRVCYSPVPRQVEQVELMLAPGSTVRDAVSASGLIEHQPSSVEPGQALQLGVWGRRVEPGLVLHAGDRVEIYRALRVDPKEARRQRYRAQGERGRRRPPTGI